jgi:hypothetical protein
MAELNKQDVQHAIDSAKNTLLQRLASRQDLQTMLDNNRERIISHTSDLHHYQLQIFSQNNQQRIDLARRAAALESRIISLEQDIKALSGLLNKFMQQHPNSIRLPEGGTNTSRNPQPDTLQYIYRGA